MKLDELAQKGSDILPTRVIMVSWLPTSAASLFLLMLIWAGAPGDIRWSDAWRTASRLSLPQVITIVALITVIAVLSHPLQIAAVRLLEGYWPRWAAPAAAVLRAGQHRRRTQLEGKVKHTEIGLNIAIAATTLTKHLINPDSNASAVPPADHGDLHAALGKLNTALGMTMTAKVKSERLTEAWELAELFPGQVKSAIRAGILDLPTKKVHELTQSLYVAADLKLSQNEPSMQVDLSTLAYSFTDQSREYAWRSGVANRRLHSGFHTSRTLPTRLGNTLASAEEKAGQGYGWDAVVTWPRLYPVLNATVRATVDGHRDVLDFAARLSITGALTATASAVLLWDSWPWLLLCTLPAAMAWISYLSAVSAADAYGVGMKVAFDLCRLDLIAALQLPRPADLAAERDLATRLCRMWRDGVPTPLDYVEPD